MLVRGGMRTIQTIGVPSAPLDQEVDAVVVALKSRTIPAAEAVTQSLAALDWLKQAGCRQFYFKYCSTFDSTPKGNIGPHRCADDAIEDTIACPAFRKRPPSATAICSSVTNCFPSRMRDHPLTPMTDANLVRVLQAQCNKRVGLLRHDQVARGVSAVRDAFSALRSAGVSLAIADAISDDDLRVLGAACADLPLVTAGSGIALGLPDAYVARGWIARDAHSALLDHAGGPAAVLSGSCSQATNAQVARWIEAGRPALAVDPLALARGEPLAERALAWARSRVANEPVLIYATTEPQALKAVQAELGATRAGELVERCLAQIACALVDTGVQRLVVAGGETSGAVVQALGVTTLRIGAAICPGVPWTQAEGRPLLLALKSGNFGGPDFFDDALRVSAR
jgi:uncharacterized protein YgbK (DUF1537 family)